MVMYAFITRLVNRILYTAVHLLNTFVKPRVQQHYKSFRYATHNRRILPPQCLRQAIGNRDGVRALKVQI